MQQHKEIRQFSTLADISVYGRNLTILTGLQIYIQHFALKITALTSQSLTNFRSDETWVSTFLGRKRLWQIKVDDTDGGTIAGSLSVPSGENKRWDKSHCRNYLYYIWLESWSPCGGCCISVGGFSFTIRQIFSFP